MTDGQNKQIQTQANRNFRNEKSEPQRLTTQSYRSPSPEGGWKPTFLSCAIFPLVETKGNHQQGHTRGLAKVTLEIKKNKKEGKKNWNSNQQPMFLIELQVERSEIGLMFLCAQPRLCDYLA